MDSRWLNEWVYTLLKDECSSYALDDEGDRRKCAKAIAKELASCPMFVVELVGWQSQKGERNV
jgi:hypothetical protein